MAMRINYEILDNHIGIFDNFYDENLIQKYIDYFNFYSNNFRTFGRNTLNVSDESIDCITSNFFNEITDVPLNYLNSDFVNIFFSKIYPLYVEKYQLLSQFNKHYILDVKIQKTNLGQGYHTWHCENDGSNVRGRICAFMLYLNDVEDGGETEFLHQKMRIKPQRNRLVLWPAYFTHAHRGNPPISGEKYILTGWTEFT